MQAASMPNAIAFIAHRSRFHLPSKPLGFFWKNLAPLSQLLKRSLLLAAHVIFINLPYGEQEHKKHSQTSKDAASVNVVEVVVPMIGYKFTAQSSLDSGQNISHSLVTCSSC